MLDGFKNLFAYMERSHAKRKNLENPPEKTPFQAWSDEYRDFSARIEKVLSSKPSMQGPELETWKVEALQPLRKELEDFKDRWNKHVDGKFSSQAMMDIDALIQRAESAGKERKE